MAESGVCYLCKRPLVWVRGGVTKALMPLDAAAVPEGNIAMKDGEAYVLKGELWETIAGFEEPRYTNHYATCPQRDKLTRSAKK